MNLRVIKFGGTSLADRAQIEKCLEITLREPARKFMVVSAPGSRFKGDIKITDLLITAAAEFRRHGKSGSADRIIKRFFEIIPEDSTLVAELKKDLDARLADIGAVNYEETIKAFGEYAGARVIDAILRRKGRHSIFMDPRDLGLRITGVGSSSMPDPACYRKVGRILKLKSALDVVVIPGFYGLNRAGQLKTLPRGGSDTSGAAIARAVGASVYENWTDEDGLKRADPRVIADAATIPAMTFGEARELAYMGFKLQDACFAPIKGAGIVLNVRNINNPGHPGTLIMDERVVDPEERIIGVAREAGFVSIGMRKLYMDKEVGFGRKMLSVPEKLKIPYEHTPDGVDSTALILAKKYLPGEGGLALLAANMKKNCRPDEIMIRELALLSVAGAGMKNHFDTHARTFTALAREKITIRMIDEGADDLSFFVGIDEDRAEDAVRAVYNEFFR